MIKHCKKVTIAHATKAKAAFNRKNQPSMTIAAVFESSMTFKEDVSNGDSDGYMDANEADEYMHILFSFPSHLLWTCCIDAPTTCAPMPIHALIDHGSPPVLISSNLTKILCLMPRQPFKPVLIGAFSKEGLSITSPLVLTLL
jgi:hypothetical protein